MMMPVKPVSSLVLQGALLSKSLPISRGEVTGRKFI